MKASALARHLPLPAGVHRDSGTLLSLAEMIANPAAVAGESELTISQKIALVKARWLAGEWSDIIYGTEGLINRDRAVHELEAQTDIGRHLMAVELQSIEMARDAAVQRGG
jgi:hypothetical protein